MSIRSLHVMSILLNTSPAAPAIEGTLPDKLAEVECSVGRIGDTVRDTSVVIRATLISFLPDTRMSDEIDAPPIGIGTGAATSALTNPDGNDSVHPDWYCTPGQSRPPQFPCSVHQSEETCAVLGGLHCRWHPTRQECEELARGGTIQPDTDPDRHPLPRTARSALLPVRRLRLPRVRSRAALARFFAAYTGALAGSMPWLDTENMLRSPSACSEGTECDAWVGSCPQASEPRRPYPRRRC